MKTGSTLIALGVLAAASHAMAANEVTREHQFSLDDIDTLEIHAGVGSIDILPASGERLEVIVRIEGKRDGWFRRSPDVSGLDLEQRQRGDRLILEQNTEGTETHWLIRMPAVASTRLHLGVGAITAELPATAVDIDLGVGEVQLDFPQQAAGNLHLKVGVGDAALHGAADIESSRAFVSQEISANGTGAQDIDIDVGVGNIDVQLL